MKDRFKGQNSKSRGENRRPRMHDAGAAAESHRRAPSAAILQRQSRSPASSGPTCCSASCRCWRPCGRIRGAINKILIVDGAREQRLNEIFDLARSNNILIDRLSRESLTRLVGNGQIIKG